MEEMIAIQLPGERPKLVKRDSEEAKNSMAIVIPNVTNKFDLWKHVIKTEGAPTTDEENDIISRADTKVKKTRTLSKKEIRGGGGMDSKFPVYIPDETEEYEAFPWEDLVKDGVTRDQARELWIDTERTALIKRKTEPILENLEDDQQPFFKDVEYFVRKASGMPSLPTEYEVMRSALSTSFKNDYEKLHGTYDEEGNLLKEGAVAMKVNAIKKRKSYIEDLVIQLDSIEQIPKEQLTQELVDNHSMLRQEYKSHITLFEQDIAELDNMDQQAGDAVQLADLTIRSYNELESNSTKFIASITNAAGGLSQILAEGMTVGGWAKNIYGVNPNNPADLMKVPAGLRGVVASDLYGIPTQPFMPGIGSYKTLDFMSEGLKDITEELRGSVRGRTELKEITADGFSLSKFSDFMMDLFSEQAMNTGLTMSTGGLGLGLIAASAGGNKMQEMNIEMEGVRDANGNWLVEPKKISALEYYGAGIGFGLAEYITERVSLGQAKGMVKALGGGFGIKNFRKAFAKEVSKESLDLTRELGGKYTLRNLTLSAVGRYGINVNQEGMAEAAASLIQNGIDIHLLGNEDTSIWDGVGDAYITGALMSGMGFQLPVITRDLSQAFMHKKTWGQIDNNTIELIKLEKEINKLLQLPVSPQTDRIIEELRNEQDELIRFNLNAQYETHNRVDNLKPEEKRRAINIMENILKKKKAIDRINNSNVDQTRKVKMINSVINQINQLEAAHGEVLNRAQLNTDAKTASKMVMMDAILKGKNIKVVKGEGIDEMRDNAFKEIDNSNLSNEQKNEFKKEIDGIVDKAKNGRYNVHGFSRSKGNLNLTFQDLRNAANGTMGNGSVFSHELSHQTLFKAITEGGGDLIEMADLVEDHIKKNYKNLYSEFLKKKAELTKDTDLNEAQRGEERLAFIIDHMRKYDINADKTLLGKVHGAWNNLLGKTKTVDQFNEIKNGEDVLMMLSSFATSFEAGEISGASAKVMKGEVKLNQATEEIKKQQNEEGRFSRTEDGSKPSMYDRTEKALGVTEELKKEFAKGRDHLLEKGIIEKYTDEQGKEKYRWTGFSQEKAALAGYQWMPEIESRIRKYSKFSDFDTYKDDLVSGVAYEDIKGARGIVDIIRRWDPSTTPDIAKWINGQLDAKIDGVRKKLGIGTDFKVRLDDYTPQEQDNILNEENLIAGNKKVPKLDLASRVKIRLKDELGKAAVLIDAKVKELMENPKLWKDKNFKDLKDLLPEDTQKMFGITPKPGNLSKDDITNSQDFILENVDVLMQMLPNGATAGGKSTGVQNVLLAEFYTKTEAAEYKTTGSAQGLPIQVKNPIPTRYTVEMVKQEDGSLKEAKVETKAYKAYKKKFLEFFGIIEDGPNLYAKNTNVSSRIKALVAQTGKMITNQAIRDQRLKEGDSVDALKYVADGKNETMFSKTLRVVGNTRPELAADIIERLRERAISPNDYEEGLIELKSELADFLGLKKDGGITPKELDNMIQDFLNIWKSYGPKGTLKNAPQLGDKTREQIVFEEIENIVTPKIAITLKGINDYDGPTGAKLFNEKKHVNAARSSLAWMLKEGILTKAEARRYLRSGLRAAGKIGDGRFLPKSPGSITVMDNPNYDPYKYDMVGDKKVYRLKYKTKSGKYIIVEGGAKTPENVIEGTGKKIAQDQRYGFFESAADVDAFIDKHGKVEGDDVGAGYSVKSSLHLNKNRLPNENEIKKTVEETKQDNAFLWELSQRLRKRFQDGNISQKQVASLIQMMNNNPASLTRTAGILDFIQEGLKPGKVELEHMTPADVISKLMFQYITGKADNGLKEYIDGYRVALISKEAHDIVNENYKSFMPHWWTSTMTSLVRYFNLKTYGRFNFKLKQLSTDKIIGPEIAKDKKAYREAQKNNLKVLKSTGVLMYSRNMSSQAIIDKLQLADKALQFARNKNKKRKGISIFDFDDTLAITDSKVIVNLKDGTQVKWTPAEFAKKAENSADLVESYDFSEFNEVKGGKPGPLLKRALELQKKFGNNDIHVLTARPQESALAIQIFLKGVGLDVKIENITGLEDGSSLAKADFVVQRAAEGYNDFYFADDQIANVEAVKTVLDAVDVKSDVQQAMFSKTLSKDFNEMIEIKKGVNANKKYSAAMAKVKGAQTGKFTFYLPPSAEDFMGLMYNFIGKGKTGDAQLKWFNENLMRPYHRAVEATKARKQNMQDDYKALTKAYPDIKNNLNKKIPNSELTYDQAIRIYIWDKNGYDIPGLSKRDLMAVRKLIKSDPNVQLFAEKFQGITAQDKYFKPGETWVVESLVSDLDHISRLTRKDLLENEFIQNVNEVFNEDNLNKIEAVYGTAMREAIEDSLYRMKNGSNRPSGRNKQVNEFMEWINNSVGATMFVNIRSATLQTISFANFINWGDNNPIKAAAAFANQKQYWKTWFKIFNSDKLKQRRGGLELNIQEAEMAEAAKKGGFKGVLALLLKVGFTPTRIADSLAIATGGSTFLINRTNTYKKRGFSQKEADARAWEDFSALSEETQQSSDPAFISKIQASELGRVLFAWQNTPFQYNRLMKKAARDLINGRGDYKSHISKILYYGAVQNFIFNSLQSALFALLPGMHGDEEEDEEREANRILGKKTRVINNMADTILRGSGLPGAIASTLKNILMQYNKQEKKGFMADHAYTVIEAINLSPPIGSKIRKMYQGIQTLQYEKDVIEARGFNLDSPIYSVAGAFIEGGTNIPLLRAVNIITNAYAALDDRHQKWQRIAMALGWNSWDIGVEPFPEHDIIKDTAKEKRKQEGIEKRKKTNADFNKVKKLIVQNMSPAVRSYYNKLDRKGKNEFIKNEIEFLKKEQNK